MSVKVLRKHLGSGREVSKVGKQVAWKYTQRGRLRPDSIGSFSGIKDFQ